MEKLKDHFRAETVRQLSRVLRAAHPSFSASRFEKAALAGLEGKELKDRVRHLASCLRTHLPNHVPEALLVLQQAIRSEQNPKGVAGFLAWPFTQYVEEYGLEHFHESLAALKEITTVMSAEFAIRPFLQKYRAETLAVLTNWAQDENVHLRRLASEGTRPRLPWGPRLVEFQMDPAFCLPILRALRKDPELYVRKSVANHLNDISKDHPALLVRELRAWQKDKDPRVQWIIRHATRSLVKAGDEACLALLGYRKPQLKQAKLKVSPAAIRVGGAIELEFSAKAVREEEWLIDYAVYHRKANGKLSAKVFKWTKKRVAVGSSLQLKKKHSIRLISTRKYYAGAHRVEVLVNGAAVAEAPFWLGKRN